ncbi:MAG: class I SAM-dependent methyltransferase [Desulfosarcina sp.]|nr:class I SAM-dependent methyltransferase [Desulfobacterales bacterium]
MNKAYYARKLNAHRLDRVYAIAGPRVRQYLQAEIDHLIDVIRSGDRVLELGCGTGRILASLARTAGRGWGVDNAAASIMLARTAHSGLHWAVMDVANLGFKARSFDVVVAVQNFISASKVPPEELLGECLRVTRPGGRILLSSYAEQFWPHRLAWFRDQAREGLLGAIDEDATGNGVIVGKDGFRATTFSPGDFANLATAAGVAAQVYEVDGSSVICRIDIG